jgi:hypothetical protein
MASTASASTAQTFQSSPSSCAGASDGAGWLARPDGLTTGVETAGRGGAAAGEEAAGGAASTVALAEGTGMGRAVAAAAGGEARALGRGEGRAAGLAGAVGVGTGRIGAMSLGKGLALGVGAGVGVGLGWVESGPGRSRKLFSESGVSCASAADSPPPSARANKATIAARLAVCAMLPFTVALHRGSG